MYKQEIIDKVNAIMGRKADIDPKGIAPEDYYDELGADSIQCIEALLEIEDAFGIDIPGSRVLNVSTMQQVYDVVGEIIVETYGFELY